MRAKNIKAVGIDKLPNEIFKFEPVIDVLPTFFQFRFDCSKIPQVWRQAVISLISKDRTKDSHIPLNYCGISLLPTLSKLYTSVINKRLLNYLEINNIIVDEQNGFRPKRSSEDHLLYIS